MVESTQNEVRISTVDPMYVYMYLLWWSEVNYSNFYIYCRALEILVNFSYTGRVKINETNVQSLMVGSSYLQLIKVRDACADFLKRRYVLFVHKNNMKNNVSGWYLCLNKSWYFRLHPQNVVGIRQFAEALDCNFLVDICNNYIDCNFPEVSVGEEYLNMPIGDLVRIIERNELQVSKLVHLIFSNIDRFIQIFRYNVFSCSEEIVFEAVMRWANFKPNDRANYLPHLLACVRLPLLSPHYIADRVATEEMIKTSHQCRYLIMI